MTRDPVDIWAEELFKGDCPYTGKHCDKWDCSHCEVEQKEREYAKGEIYGQDT